MMRSVACLFLFYDSNLEILLQFLLELTKLFQKARASGSVTMTFKRCKYFVAAFNFFVKQLFV